LKLEGFSEISPAEQLEINGGIIPFILGRILIGIAIAAGAKIIDDWDNFKNGLQGLPEDK